MSWPFGIKWGACGRTRSGGWMRCGLEIRDKADHGELDVIAERGGPGNEVG